MKNVIREKRNFLPLINGIKFVKVADAMSASEMISDEVCESFLKHPGYREATDSDNLPETIRPASSVQKPAGDSDDLEGLSVTALKRIAKKQKIAGYSQMDKPALIEAINAEEDGDTGSENDPKEPVEPSSDEDRDETKTETSEAGGDDGESEDSGDTDQSDEGDDSVF